MKGRLLLIPTSLSSKPLIDIHPTSNIEEIRKVEVFVVETGKVGRASLKGLYEDKEIRNLEIMEYSMKSRKGTLEEVLELLERGKVVGYMSDAGYPAVADDGRKLVEEAQNMKVQIKTLSGPSSLLQTLASSGLNGENFEYVGYLPATPDHREREIASLEKNSPGKALIIIETPYRAQHVLNSLLKTLERSTYLCLGRNIDHASESVITNKVGEWQKKKPELGKEQVVFIVQP